MTSYCLQAWRPVVDQQPRACKPFLLIWVWQNSDLCLLGFIQLLLFFVELEGNEEGREKDKQEGQTNWTRSFAWPLYFSAARWISLWHLSFILLFLHFCWINQRLLFDPFCTKAVSFCHFSPPSSSSLCSPWCLSTLQYSTFNPSEEGRCSFVRLQRIQSCTDACVRSQKWLDLVY